MENSIYKLSRQDIIHLKGYQSARMIGDQGHVWLNANESPYEFIFNIKNLKYNRYPEFQPKKLIEKYSIYSNTSIENILVSRGSDEAIELLIRVFCRYKKDYIIICPPTYAMYSKISEIYGIHNIFIPMFKNCSLNVKKIKLFSLNSKLIYICRPNNPTGHIIDVLDIIDILEYTSRTTIVVIDEAYIEFCINDNLIYLLKQYHNLVILRTLSKAFGLAGIRCGFAVANVKIIKLLKKVITPYPLPVPSIYIANKALNKKGILRMQSQVKLLNNNKSWLIKEINKISFVEYVYPSSTNYILVQFKSSDYVFRKLLDQGIVLRDQSHIKGLLNCIRISIGSYEECVYLINALRSISSC
ncbi:Histidinol-phosphate aminotransferase [Buchnera aphidicola (Panaphis juglandis)]